jgi:hypothetical protein
MIYRCIRWATLVAIFVVVHDWSPTSRGQEPKGCPPVPNGAVAMGSVGGPGMACRPWEYGNPALFYNFYVPNQCGGVPAPLYVAPHPVPQLAGHTYYTYQPLMPHEFLYPHYRTYHKTYDEGRGINRTAVLWYSNPVATVVKDVRELIRIPR